MVERLKQIVLLVFAFLFLLSTCLHTETPVSAQTMNNPYELVVATIGEPDTVDPAWAYDTASSELIFNVYETLIFYNRESVDEFVPMLATDWHISEDGLTYTFKMREGIKFHNGEILTTEDVEYSFERAMVHDALTSPTWMLYEALLGCRHANLSDPDWHVKIENAVEINSTYAWFHLVEPYAPFLQILCQSWSSIVNKEFCVEHGDWPANETGGKWFWPGGDWTQYYNPENSPLDTNGDWMCGTGPYKFDYWSHGDFGAYSLVKFHDYWQGWPAPNCEGYVSRATVKFIPYWVRKEMLLNRTADIISVSREYIEEIEGAHGIRCVKDLPTLAFNAFFFTFDINTTSPYMGVPGGLPCGTFNESGIPPDFFNDTNIRKGFAYSFNWTRYVEDEWTYGGEAIQPASPIIEGVPYRNADQEKYCLNLTEAEACFRSAWNGQIWEEGFTMTVAYSVGAIPRFIWIEAFRANVESLNPKFHINMEAVHWLTIITSLVHCELPMFNLGWLGDYPDPHDFIRPFMHSTGDFAYFQSYSNATVDALVQEGLRTLNTTRRREIYYELQSTYHKECPSVPTVQPLTRHWERDWVQGWYYNPAYPGIYFYHLWKQAGLQGDLNNDGIVNIEDIAIIAKAFGSHPGHPRWNETADINSNGIINIIDLATVAKEFGKTA